MVRNSKLCRTALLAAASALALCSVADGAHAKKSKETVLYSFAGGSDGNRPWDALVQDSAGNLYGTTANGGGSSQCNYGCGTIFMLAPDGTESVLHAFAGGGDGGFPVGSLIFGKGGDLYGTTTGTGGSNAGTVFKITPNGKKETVLHSFGTGNDGAYPYGALVADEKGNLYGTTILGGNGFGVVFKVTPKGKETVLYAFSGGSDGSQPYAALIMDAKGDLYGTTSAGGDPNVNGGVVFKLTPKGKEATLHTFAGNPDGAAPFGGLIQDAAGNFYGTTQFAGAADAGVVFRMTPSGRETVLYTFSGGGDGAEPLGGLLEDTSSNLYGTTSAGGTSGAGVVFKLTPGGQETVLHSFTGSDGASPYAGVIMDKKGDLYGTSYVGGAGAGTVFKVTN